ncbi:PQQ-binding-like beta-propeller repeat protein [Seonamhaeicola algicola]|uniref:PQQ-binding-like beta-propeller repeat protein n=1 Tax=Seonamhaeicola algicola TaxID=1719036 RepID=A0A5C7ABX4_9FLAO|nr:PQQ-binding-like beta-propeller repeat protein [Seonamhaeicola algicola]TXE06078.1 PQQ-binding-like beta-propeller repeat protein [Seonamhaeicola algicola]
MRTLKTLVFLLASTLILNAQKAETPENSYNLGANINQMTLTVAGTLVVATNDGLVGIKPDTNQLLFNFTDYGRVKPEELNFVPMSPYVMVGQTGIANLSAKKAVIDHVSGKVLFTTESKGWKNVFTCDVIMPQNKLVVSGFQKGGGKAENVTPKVGVYDLATGNLDYEFFLTKPGKVTMKYFAVTGTPMLLKDKLLVPTSQGILAKSKTGETLWENKVKNVNWMTTNETESDIYAFAATTNGKNTRIYKLNASGNEVWTEERKVKGNVSNFEILPQGLAVVSDVTGGSGALGAKAESKITMFSAATGDDLWEKAPKTKGYVQHFYVQDDGILFGVYEGGINKISFDGNTLFKKPLKTGENIMLMAQTPQGLIYITSEDANIVDLKTGEQVWSKPLKYKRAASVASTFDAKNNRYLIAADGKIMAIDANSGSVSDFAKCNFDEKEDPNTMQIRNGGVFLSSDQNMTLINFDGKENYHAYYKSPGRSTFGKIAGGVLAVASTAMTVGMSMKAGANRSAFGSVNDLDSYNETGKQAKRAADMFAGIASASFDYLSTRFKATAATENAQFILTNLDGGAGLVKVNKDSGKIDKEIMLKDKKPEYEVDELGGYLFYKANDKTIYSYNLNK